jgi:hypothetical protein
MPTDEQTETPLPCPFCGEEPMVIPQHGEVECSNIDCNATVYIATDDINKTLKLWNTRASK